MHAHAAGPRLARQPLLGALCGALLLAACQGGSTLDPGGPGGADRLRPDDVAPGGGGGAGAGGGGGGAGPRVPVGPSGITWHQHVQPLVRAHCQGCHEAGGIAPFALTTYAEAAALHPSLAHAVSTGSMPPWMPSDACVPLQGARRLTPAERDVFVKWSLDGAPEGDVEDAPPLTALPAPKELPWVDLVLKAPEPYTPDGKLSDDYRCLPIDPKLTEDRDVIGIDFVPGTRAQVHHVILYGLTADQAKKQDDAEAGPGWTCFGAPGDAFTPPQMIGAWAPGAGLMQAPKDSGIRIPKGTILVMQMHYNTANGVLPDQTAVKLQLSKAPVPKPATLAMLAIPDFKIPPHASGHRASKTFNWGLLEMKHKKIWGVAPHLHTLGRRVTVKHNGECLIDIPTWDFHWQQYYAFDTEAGRDVKLGDTLELTCEWDNPTDREVTWGENTTDEMCLNFLYLTE